VTIDSQKRELSRLCTAVVFCGGQGTRLREQLKGSAKALALLHHQPYLLGLLKQIANANLKEVLLCVSPFTKDIITTIRGGREVGLHVRYSIDSGLQENADALWQARNQIRTPLALCINGDTIFDVDLPLLLRAHLKSKAIATMVGSERVDQPHPDGLEVAPDNWVIDLHEWAQDLGIDVVRSTSAKCFSNSGVYVFDMRRLKRNWSPTRRVGKIEQGLLRDLARKRQLMAMNNGHRYLLDIGTPDRLMIARSQLASISPMLAL